MCLVLRALFLAVPMMVLRLLLHLHLDSSNLQVFITFKSLAVGMLRVVRLIVAIPLIMVDLQRTYLANLQVNPLIPVFVELWLVKHLSLVVVVVGVVVVVVSVGMFIAIIAFVFVFPFVAGTQVIAISFNILV